MHRHGVRVARQAGRLEAGGPGEGGTENEVQAPFLGAEAREEAEDTDRGESEPSQCFVF